MARLHVNKYPIKKQSSLDKPLIVVVDMINGFILEGALHDKAILQIVEPMKQLLNCHMDRVFFADCHQEDAVEFQSYPLHCVKGTTQSEVINDLKPYVTTLIEKNSTNGFFSEGWQRFMKTELDQYRDIIITGCCTDICVLQFALSLRTWLNDQNMGKQHIIVPVDMVETYHIDGVHDAYTCNEFALQNMGMNGIEIVQTMEKG